MLLGERLLRLLYSRAPPSLYDRPLREVGGGLLLDLGGGAGHLADLAGKRGAEGVVADLSRGLLELGRGVSHRVRCVAEKPCFREGVFHTIVLHDALHHFREPSGALEEAARLVRKGGRILVFDYDAGSPLVKILSLVERAVGFPASFMRAEEVARVLGRTCSVRRVEKRWAGSYFIEAAKPA